MNPITSILLLTAFNSLLLFNETDSYPLSENEISNPPALVPVIDLKDAFIDVFCGDNVLNCGINELYWKFWVALQFEDPDVFSSLKFMVFDPPNNFK